MERLNNLALAFRMAWKIEGESLNYMLSNIGAYNFEKGMKMLIEDNIISEMTELSSFSEACIEAKNGNIVVAISGNKVLSMAKSSRGSNMLVNDKIASTVQFERETKGVNKFYILKK